MTALEHHEDDIKAKIDILRASIKRRETIVRVTKDNDLFHDRHEHESNKIKEEKLELAAIKKEHPEEFV